MGVKAHEHASYVLKFDSIPKTDASEATSRPLLSEQGRFDGQSRASCVNNKTCDEEISRAVRKR